MNYKRCFAAIVIVAIAACAVLGIVFVVRKNLKMGIDLTVTSVRTEATTQFVAEIQGDNQVRETELLQEPEQEIEPITTEIPTDMQIDITTEEVTQLDYFAEIIINTCEKTGTYKVMPNVNEETLKNNVGWLPSSSVPGEEGLCVLMGHRDTDFRILQYIKVGDEIIVDYGMSNYVYTVTKLEIISKNDKMMFETITGSNLVMVTCYPFKYTGHAPQKFVVYAKRVDDK